MARKKPEKKAEKSKTKILIVDDHPIVRQGLAQLINQEDDLVVCGQAEGANQALSTIKKTRPDTVIVDISLKDRSGLELIKDIRAQHPDLAVLALSMHDESLYAERALRAGARGYVMKAEATENVVKAIRQVFDGGVYLSDKMSARMMHKLVGREADVSSSDIDRLSRAGSVYYDRTRHRNRPNSSEALFECKDNRNLSRSHQGKAGSGRCISAADLCYSMGKQSEQRLISFQVSVTPCTNPASIWL
jgi:DNA-binding NarL/FixJ family response regulator